MEQYVDRKRRKEEEYQKKDLVMLSTKNLKWQIKGRRIEKLMEQFMDLITNGHLLICDWFI